MAFQVFPYREEEPRPGKTSVRRPTVDLRLSFGRRVQTIRALVDTGSPYCIMGRAVADALDIDMGIGRGEDKEIHILGGIHNARMAMAGLELPPFDGIVWEANCAFLYGELVQSFLGVLGQEGFLDRWVASFNYYDSYFVIEERDAFVERLGIDPVDYMKGHFDSEWDRPTKH
jgi:hypothetical protein